MRSAALLALTTWALAASSACQPAPPAPDAWKAERAAWKTPAPLPSFPLVDQDGRAFHLRDLKGAPLLVGFVFTNCPVADACPLTMARMVAAAELLHDVRVSIVTIDPERDTPAVLKAYGQRFHVDETRTRLATGDRAVIDAMTSLFNVIAVKQPDGNIAHPVKAALLDENLAPKHEWTDNNFSPLDIKDILDATHPQ